MKNGKYLSDVLDTRNWFCSGDEVCMGNMIAFANTAGSYVAFIRSIPFFTLGNYLKCSFWEKRDKNTHFPEKYPNLFDGIDAIIEKSREGRR